MFRKIMIVTLLTTQVLTIGALAADPCQTTVLAEKRAAVELRLRVSKNRLVAATDQLESQGALRTVARLRSAVTSGLVAVAAIKVGAAIGTVAGAAIGLARFTTGGFTALFGGGATGLKYGRTIGSGLAGMATLGTSMIPTAVNNWGLSKELDAVTSNINFNNGFQSSLEQLDAAHIKIIDLTHERSERYKGNGLSLGWNTAGYLSVQVEKAEALIKLDLMEAAFYEVSLAHIDTACRAILAGKSPLVEERGESKTVSQPAKDLASTDSVRNVGKKHAN